LNETLFRSAYNTFRSTEADSCRS